MEVEIKVTREGFKYAVSVIVDGTVKERFVTPHYYVIRDRNRYIQHWTEQPGVTKVTATAIPPIPELRTK